MAVTVICPSCSTNFSLGEDLIGKKIRCKNCGEVFVAAAARVKVGAAAAGPDQRIKAKSPPERGTSRNGDHHDLPAKKQPAKADGGATMKYALVGAGVAVVALLGVVAFLLTREPEEKPAPPPVVRQLVQNTDKPSATATPDKDGPKDDAKATAAANDDKPAEVVPKVVEQPKLTVLPSKMKPETITACKKRTVYIKTLSEQGGATGSGWLAEKNGERGLIVTNAHVIDMKERPNPQPRNVRVIFNAGEADERSLGCTILAVDHINDLAILEIRGKDLPEPYPIEPSAELFDTQPLVVFGFPRGGQLAGSDKNPKISVRNSSVSGRKYSEWGGVDNIQIEGGVDGGNSGGPIADTAGRLRCVSVAGLGGSQIAWAVPAEYVLKLLHGHVVEFVPGQPVPGGSGVKMPFLAEVIDPLQRLSKVSVDVWVGNKPTGRETSTRPGGSRPSFESGDGPRSSGDTNYSPTKIELGKSKQVSGELALPACPTGKVYWVQPRYVGKDGKERYGEAVVLPLPNTPVEPRPVSIVVKHKTGMERKLALESRNTIYFSFGGSFGTNYVNFDADLIEKTGLVDADGNAKLRYVFQNIKHLKEELADIFKRLNSGVIQRSAKGMAFESQVSKFGKVTKTTIDMSGVPMVARGTLEPFARDVSGLVEYFSLNLPEKEMSPGDTWNNEVIVSFNLGNNSAQNLYLDNQFRYIGSRVRNGRQEAVVTMETKVTKSKKADTDPNTGGTSGTPDDDDNDPTRRKPFWGRAFAAAAIDVETGYVGLARVYSEIEFEIPVQTNRGITHALINNKVVAVMRRGLDGQPPPTDDVDTVLPFTLFPMNPLEAYPKPSGVSIAEEPTRSKDEMTPETRAKVTKATVILNVERAGQDSITANSFLVHPSGLVVTTADLVGLVNRESRRPSKVTATIESGTADEREYPADLVAFDSRTNLAVFKVNGDKFPEPLTVAGSDDLVGTQPLVVSGYPGLRISGQVRAAALRNTSFVAKREIQANLPWVQVEGGVGFDNFGGPLVDTQGVVRGVSMYSNPAFSRQIAFCAPGEAVQRLVNGCGLTLTGKFPYRDGSDAKMPVELDISDPLKRVAKVEVEYWLGRPGKARPETNKPPKAGPDDQPRKSAVLAHQAGQPKATGELLIPEVPTGQVLWLQPKVTDADGKSVWGQAYVSHFEGAPVERTSTTLMPRYKKGTVRTLELTSIDESRLAALAGGRNYQTITNAEIQEGIDSTFAKGGGRFVYKYNKVKFALNLDSWARSFLRDVDKMTDDDIQNEFRYIALLYNSQAVMAGVSNAAVVDREGKITQVALLDNVFPTVAIHNQRMMKILQATSLPLPCREVKAGETWEQKTDLVLDAVNRQEPALFTVKYKYVGQRLRQGRNEAVVEIAGDLTFGEGKSTDFRELKTDAKKGEDTSAPLAQTLAQSGSTPGGPSKRRVPLYGNARGIAYIDVETGQVMQTVMDLEADVEVNVKDPNTKIDVPSIAGVTMSVTLKRSSTDR